MEWKAPYETRVEIQYSQVDKKLNIVPFSGLSNFGKPANDFQNRIA